MNVLTLPLKRRNVGAQRHKFVRDLLIFAEAVGAAQECEHLRTSLAERIELAIDRLEFAFNLDPFFNQISVPLIGDRTIESNQLLEVALDLAFEKDASLLKKLA